MQIFTLTEWNDIMEIHPKIKPSLEPLGIEYIYGREDPDLRFFSYSKYCAYKKKPNEWNEDRADYFLYLVGNWMKQIHFSDLRYELNKKIQAHQTNIIILNGKRNPLFNQFPEEITIFHNFKDNRLTPQPRTYKKKGMYEKLKKLFDDVPNLPYQPLEIHGFGSFLREKENIGDVDLKFVHDDNNPRWQRFYNFFAKRGEKYSEFINLLHEEYKKEVIKLNQMQLNRMKLNQTKLSQTESSHIISSQKTSNRIISLQKKCEQEEFIKILEKYKVDKDLLKYCMWSEVLEFDNSGFFFPNPDKLFLRMFRKNKRGFQVHSGANKLNDGKVYALLWSKECPSFETNYSQWKERESELHIKKEYSHLLKDIEARKKDYEKKTYPIQLKDTIREYVIRELSKIQAEFPIDAVNTDSYEELNRKTNALREKTKVIQNEIERLKTKERLFNIVGVKQYVDKEENKSKS